MRIEIFGSFVAEGTVEELSEYTARTCVLLKEITDQIDRNKLQKELKELWDGMQNTDKQ